MSVFYKKSAGLALCTLFCATSLYAQQTLTGSVSDSNGPVSGASVTIKGTNRGTQTKANGTFSIQATAGETLRITIVGYKSQEIKLGSSNTVNIILTEDASSLDEVVVTALGVKKEKRALGYASTTISTEDLADKGSAMNAMTSMYGTVPGLKLNLTGMGPAGGINVNIRNAVSFSESSNVRPLFVIDGIPMLDWQTDINRSPGNGLNDLNMDDIASFEILRGAKAALLYGSNGANGVILITSKSGRKRPGYGIDVNLAHQFDKPWVLQELQNEFGSGYPVNWGAYGNNYTPEGFYKRNDQASYAPVTYNFGPRFNGQDLLYYDNTMKPYVAQPDNIRDLYRNGHTSTANVSIQGGGDLGGFRLAYTNKNYEGIFEGFKIKENKVTFNGNMSLTDNVNLRLVSTYSNSFNHNPPNQNQDAFVTYGLPRNLDVKALRNQIFDPETGYFFFYMNNIQAQYATGSVVRENLAKNYLYSQQKDKFDNSRNHFTNSLNLDIKLNKNLSFTGIGGFDWIINDNNTYEALRRPLSQGVGGSAGLKTEQNVSWNGQAMLRYEKDLNPDWNLSSFIGAVYLGNSYRMLSRSTNGGFITDNWESLGNSKNDLRFSDSRIANDGLYGIFGSAQLSYKNRLFFDIQGRNDWSSILPPKNNSYFYPGVSSSWVFSESIDAPEWLTMGKLRASWADAGRPGSRYFSNNVYSIGSYDGAISYSSPSTIPPKDLQPERKREFEIGFDTKFLNSRLGLEFSYFSGITYNQIMALSLASSSGYNAIAINAGKVSTKGYEFSLTATPVKTNSFSWDMIINGSASKPVVKELYDGINTQNLWGASGARIVAKENQPYGQILVKPFAVNDKGERLVGNDGLYYTDQTQDKLVGKVTPDFIGGLINNFSYKGLTLGLNFDASFGSTLISQTNMYMRGSGSSIETLAGRDEASGGLPYYVDNNGSYVGLPSHNTALPNDSKYPMIFHDGVILPGVKQDGTPNDRIINAGDKYAYYWQSFMEIQEDVVYKNDYIKLRNITLSYALPKSITSKMKFEKLIVSGFMNNVAFLHRTMPNVDPESNNGTNVFYENNAFPTTRSIGFSLRATF
ncbi:MULTISPECIES: SusC/RagA family TonB-linked outer membrane protein [Sphingobacterium]|uniref:SusC/RagA family TonB-linked outer membrane protein n=1 Tax=Sphingobacterium TaxID=28453 RepID=UPI00104740BC|nr:MULTISPECIES: SusC/RagA family TonB-linked outer membrane protein [unclassified Sphingobacterium]MCS3555462.1 iron complex outermembrane receptor protein [Sphingobacterium sp. JUb21]TCR02386.1 iron complex outermembrane receptor protein [Sphingobacterium sp. JUb20]